MRGEISREKRKTVGKVLRVYKHTRALCTKNMCRYKISRELCSREKLLFVMCVTI